jgi:hypothetical protein
MRTGKEHTSQGHLQQNSTGSGVSNCMQQPTPSMHTARLQHGQYCELVLLVMQTNFASIAQAVAPTDGACRVLLGRVRKAECDLTASNGLTHFVRLGSTNPRK